MQSENSQRVSMFVLTCHYKRRGSEQ